MIARVAALWVVLVVGGTTTAAAGAGLPLAVWEGWEPAPVVLPEPNAADVYQRAGELYDSISKAHAGPPKPLVFPPQPEETRDPWGVDPEGAPLGERVALYAEVLGLVREGLAMECRFAPAENYLSLFPALHRCRAICRLLCMESAYHAEGGRWGAAAQSALDALQLGRDVSTQRDLLSSLVGSACVSLAMRQLAPAVGHLDAEDARRCLERLQATEAEWVPAAEVVDGEERLARLNFQYILSEPALALQRVRELMELNGVEPTPGAAVRVDLWASWRELGEFYDAVRGQAREPMDCRTDPVLPAYAPASLIANAQWRGVLARCGWCLAQVRMAQVQAAAQVYRQEKGHWPAGLEELVPQYLPRAPRDPFADGPLHFVAGGDGPVIYSAGADGDDDGGRVLEMRGPSVGDGDYVVQPGG